MKFTYRALLNGQIRTGKVEAFSEREVAEYLRNNGFFPIEVKRDVSFTVAVFPTLFNSVKQTDITHFTREMAIMLNAGLTLSSSLEILIKQTSKATLRDLYTQINNDIKSGQSYSGALGKHPKHFPRLYISLVKAGEASGKLNDILMRLAEDLDRQREFAAKIKSAMTYPVMILIGVVGVIFVLLTFVVPQLLGLYRDLDIELPFTTQLLITVSDALVKVWPLVIAAVVIAVTYIRKKLKTDEGRYLVYTVLMRIPVLGNVVKISSLVTTIRTLSLLISSGVLVLESIGIVIAATSNIVFQKALENVYRNIQKGVTISFALEKEQIFPPILVQMTAVGEKTGKLDEILLKISEYFEQESNIAIKALTTIMEPLILAVLGGVVLFVVMAVITPIYTLTSNIGK